MYWELNDMDETDTKLNLDHQIDCRPYDIEHDDLCDKCGLPLHPCLPCEEVIMFYNHVDDEYFKLLNLILNNGKTKVNRTGMDTIGIFGAQAKFDIDLNAFPILTTKKVHFKSIVHELLWFIRGDTNIKYLVDNDVDRKSVV